MDSYEVKPNATTPINFSLLGYIIVDIDHVTPTLLHDQDLTGEYDSALANSMAELKIQKRSRAGLA